MFVVVSRRLRAPGGATGRHHAAVSRLHLPDPPQPDPKQADLLRDHDAAWRWFQAGELARAESGFAAVLKRSPQFYPSETAIGYLDLARKNFEQAVERFDRVLQSNSAYVPALVGRGEALLALSREPEALAAFEAAVKLDPQLQTIARRVEVLRARAQQENVAAARKAAQSNRLDEAARLYEQAIAASPDSAFLVRDLAEVEAKQGKTEQALARYRRVVEMDPTDAASRMRIGEILDAQGDLEGAMKMYTEANNLEPSAELRRRMAAIDTRLAYLKLPAEYRAIPSQPSITRGDLASLIGIRLSALVERAPAQAVVITDARNHWASEWIMATAGAGRDGVVREPHVPAPQPRPAQRPGSGGRSHAESHRGGATAAVEGLAEPPAEDVGCGRQQPALCRRVALGRRRNHSARRRQFVPIDAPRQRRRGDRRDHPHRAPVHHLEMSVLTPANQLTLTRVLLAPAFVILTVYGYFGWALIVFAVAGLTDLLDGLIARTFRGRTSLGAWLDPMADKLLIVATVSVLTLPGLGLVNKLPVWLTILIITRDLLIVVTVAVINLAIGRREFRPSIYGKIATATYILTCVTIMYFNYLQRTSPVVTFGIYASAAITLISGFHYVFNVTKIINQN